MERFLIKNQNNGITNIPSTSSGITSNNLPTTELPPNKKSKENYVELSDVDSPNEINNIQDKKGKKIRKRKQNFRPIWIAKFLWLEKKSDDANGVDKPFCKFCNKLLTNNSVHLQRHEDSELHKSKISALKRQPEIFKRDTASFSKKIMQAKTAELKIIMFLLEHNLPFVLVNSLISLIQSIAVDSNITKELKCGKTKATETTNTLIFEEGLEKFAVILRNQKFSIIIDETTDISTKKCLVLVVRFFDYISGTVTDKFFGLIELENADAKSIFDKIIKYFEMVKVPLSNIIGFASDNASVMMGNKGGVKVLLQNINENLYVMGCTCHSIHLCSSAASKMLPQKIEHLARNIYSFFAHSSKRQHDYAQFQEYFNVKHHKILKTASTRWLSLENVVSRILGQWVPLKHYFISNEFETDSDVARNISREITDENKIYFYFLSYILNLTNKINIEYQAEAPRIHLLLPTIKSYYKTILTNFIKAEYINQSCLNQLDFSNKECFLKYNQIYIGAKADLLIKGGNVSESSIKTIKDNCCDYYMELCRQITSRIAFEDEVLIAVQAIDPKLRAPTLTPLIIRFPNLIMESYIQDLDEWRQLLNQEYIDINLDIEKFWAGIFNLKNATGGKMFPRLTDFIGAILSFPHSSATAERVFSQVVLIKNKQRNSLATCTVNSILMAKEMLKQTDASHCVPTKDLLAKYKK